MKKPTLEEVKEYFKNAETVESKFTGQKDNVTGEFSNFRGDWHNLESEHEVEVWNESRGFAKILTTKQPAYSITADQLMQLENGFTLPKLKKWFPEVFVKKLEVGKWYKTFFKDGGRQWGVINVTGFEPGKIIYYGFLLGIYSEKDWCHDENIFKEATEQEVFEDLKNEAVKRGFVEGAVIRNIETSKEKYLKLSGIGFYLFNEKTLNFGNQVIFNNGIWAKVYQKL